MTNLFEALQSGKTLLLDGAMGTMLSKKGLELDGAANLNHPAIVRAVHQEYIAAGSDLIITNSFSLNRIYATAHGWDFDLKSAVKQSVLIAKSAAADAGKPVYVLGGLAPTGQMLAPLGNGDPREFLAAFKEQAQVMDQAGADGLIIETMFDLAETLLAVEACKAVSKLPIFASMTFFTAVRGGRTMMGNKASDCALRLAEAGCAVVGLNCGDVEICKLAEIIANMKAVVDLPILIEPNAGKPELVGDQAVYHMPPAEFAEAMQACVASGARILGGCCGTTPQHIAALKGII